MQDYIFGIMDHVYAYAKDKEDLERMADIMRVQIKNAILEGKFEIANIKTDWLESIERRIDILEDEKQ